MTTGYVLSTVAIVILLMLSFFFSGSETALTAAARARMTALETAGDKRAALVNRLLQKREQLIGAILLGNNLVNIAASALAARLFLEWFGEVGLIYATIAMTALVVIFSEVMPKTIAINHPDRMALLIAPPIKVIVSLFGPVTIAIEVIVRRLLGLMAQDKKVRRGALTFILARGIGKAFVQANVDPAPVRALLDQALRED
jgi:Mg2+/Co2+ transporter CorB